jgi:hypothetical protein
MGPTVVRHEVPRKVVRVQSVYIKISTFLGQGGDFEALHCQPSTNFDRSKKLDLTTEPPLLPNPC